MDYSMIYPFWSDLKDQEIQMIENSLFTEKFEKGEMMYHCNENCKGLMTVLKGDLRAYIISDEGREITLFRVREGEVCVLSASCLMDSISFDVLIEALDNTEVLVLPTMILNQVISNNPYVELYLYKAATEKFSEVMWTMQQIMFLKIDQRVAHFIWDEMVKINKTELNMTHDEIAKLIGSAREVVSKVLKYLSESGAIELGRGRITIVNKEKLKKYL